MDELIEHLQQGLATILDLGGPVVMILLGLSVIVLAVTLYKLWQHASARVGRHTRVRAALDAWDRGDRAAARREVEASRSHLAPLVAAAMRDGTDPELRQRLETEAEANLAKLESGFRILDSIAQIAPLLGLFGTVLGMISAFQALQQAGAAVDPSILAGGIWVALLTTAAGLAVAMPTSLILAWLESRTVRERDFAALALARAAAPGGLNRDEGTASAAALRPAHA
ncbi:MotA/TolQ/ExbB proton channel family protein [Jannaschia sp. 2305UL9-9]|uniref:MotA/TolQ/ExbB proton channel family protein n=1 Tax=Jannaschia sp. 2305UL9-9 TaxID=3121638 RepID=UPI00352797F1